jgi:Peptidase M50B-like
VLAFSENVMTATGPRDSILHGMSAVQPQLPAVASAGLGLLALAAVVVPGLWALTQHVDTMAHEGAHAVMGSATGRRIVGVTMSSSGDGATLSTGGGRAILTGVAGYFGSSAAGLAAAELIRVGHPVAVLWVAVVALAVLAVLARRSLFGLTAVLSTGLGIYLVARYASLGMEVALAYALTWFLLLAGVRVVLAHGRGAGDAVSLRQRTGVPRGVWAALWLAGSALALIVGARMLI